MRCSLKNKSKTKHKRNVDDYSSTFQVFGLTRRKKQVTSTNIVNVCMFYLRLLLWPNFGMFCKQQTLYFTLESHTGTSTEALNVLP